MRIGLICFICASLTHLYVVQARPLRKSDVSDDWQSRRNKREVRTAADAWTFFYTYGWTDKETGTLDELSAILKSYQSAFGLYPTGRLDMNTMKKMESFRCGNTDNMSRSLSQRRKRYNINNDPNKRLVCNGQIIKYNIVKYSEYAGRPVLDADVLWAAQYWNQFINVTFQKAASPNDDVALTIGFYSGPHSDGHELKDWYTDDKEMGHASTRFIHINDGKHEEFVKRLSHNGYEENRLRLILLHELGHVIGLEHSWTKNSVMLADYTGVSTLHKDDIVGAHQFCPQKPTCANDEYMCDDETKRCILRSKLCDTIQDCLSGADERNCVKTSDATCNSNQYFCAGMNKCLDRSQVCSYPKESTLTGTCRYDLFPYEVGQVWYDGSFKFVCPADGLPRLVACISPNGIEVPVDTTVRNKTDGIERKCTAEADGGYTYRQSQPDARQPTGNIESTDDGDEQGILCYNDGQFYSPGENFTEDNFVYQCQSDGVAAIVACLAPNTRGRLYPVGADVIENGRRRQCIRQGFEVTFHETVV